MKPVDPTKGYELDTSFIQEQHHTNPRRLYSQTGADWQYRVDHERLRRQRLERIRAKWKRMIWERLLCFKALMYDMMYGKVPTKEIGNITLTLGMLCFLVAAIQSCLEQLVRI